MTSRFVRFCLPVALAAATLVVRAQAPAAPAPAPVAPAPSAKLDDDLVNVQLPDADIDTVLSALEQLTDRTVLRPNALVTPTFNIKIKKQIPRREAILAIETVLALNGVGVAPQGDRFLIVTMLNVTKSNTPEMITGSTFDQPPSGKPAIKIFMLEFLRVQEFVGMIGGITNPAYGQPVMLVNANALLVTDSVSNLQRIEMLVQTLDKPMISGMTPKFYPCHNSKASDIVGKLHTILGGGVLQQQLGQATSYTADDRTNQIVLVTDPRQYSIFDDLISKLDVKSDPNTRNEVMYLKHADAKDVASLLQQLVTSQSSAAQRANAQSLRPGTPTIVNPTVPGAPAAPVAAPAAGLDTLLGSGSNEFSSLITVIPDIRSNAIVVSGTIDDLRLVSNIVDKLDIILAQVRIEVVTAEVTLDDNHTSGISQLGLVVSGDRLTGFSGTEASVTVTNGTLTNNSVTGHRDLAATLAINTTPRKSDTSIISMPSITTTHNKKAKFFFGETRPVVTGTTSTPTAATTTSGFSTSSQVNQQEIGTTITVQPLIGNDGSVQLDIQQDISDVTGTVQIDNNAQYIIGKRTTNSYVTAQSGDILVFAGMQKKKYSKSTSRLGPIPILGDLFGTRNKDDQRTELIFFIRPVVLTNTANDNAPALKRVNEFDHREDILEDLDPNYKPAKKSWLPFVH